MLRSLHVPFFLVCLTLLLPAIAVAEEPVAEPAPPRVVSGTEAADALARFKDDYKASGLKGEEKLLQRDYALSELARVQHPDAVAALAKIARGSNETLRTLAVIYLGEQTALPGLAGPPILKAMKRAAKDPILLISGLQSMGNLKFLGAADEIKALIAHRDFAVKKAAIQSVGEIREIRLWKEILKLAGVSVRSGDDVEAGTDQQSNKEEVVEEGYSYEGVEVFYDTGTAGDGDQKMAEKIGKAKLAANKRAAMAKSGGRGGSGGAGSGATGRGGVARDPRELLPFVLHTLFQLTGEHFTHSRQVAKWVRKNREVIHDRVKALDVEEKEQRAAAKKM